MSLHRYAARRDANEPALVRTAIALGAEMIRAGPLDWWAGVRGRWVPVECKSRLGRYTPAQQHFLRLCEARGLPVWTWRTEDDVLRDLGARRSA